MKRATTILLAALLAASLTACGVVGDESSAPASGAASEAAASEAEVSESTASAEESAPAESPLSDFEFAENDTGMTVVKYLGDAEHVIIPAAVDGKPVTEIKSEYGTIVLTYETAADGSIITHYKYTLDNESTELDEALKDPSKLTDKGTLLDGAKVVVVDPHGKVSEEQKDLTIL